MQKRLSLYTFLLCLVPFFVWIFSWKWQGDLQLTSFDYFLYLLTETGSVPYALISCVILACLFFPIFTSKTRWIVAVALMVTSMIVTQGVKTVAKTFFAEPRPYVTVLAENSDISIESFYAQPRQQRAEIVKQFYADKIETPAWLVDHRADETGYSFPSGHSIFAASWLLLALGFTQLERKKSVISKILVTFMLLWAALMLVSRLRLGMHYPIDLLISLLLAWLVHCYLFSWFQKNSIKLENWVEKRFSFLKER